MKYSVWDYSQVKIAQFNESHPDLAIDPTDIFIFTWFKGFATKTRSKAVKENGTTTKGMWTKTIDGIDYFNVRYDAIIKDFPILSFSSVKSIQRRFDKYVAAGIFEKKIIYRGKHGNFTYFAFTDLFWSFEYDNENPEHKQDLSDNSIQTKQVSADNSVQTKQVGADNSVQTLIYNPVTSLNNPTTTSLVSEKASSENQETKHIDSKSPEEEVFYKTIINLFGYNPCFNPNPYPTLIHNFSSCNLGIENLQEYLDWIFKYLEPKCKNKDNFASYFYKSFTQPVYITRFAHTKAIEEQKLKEKELRKIECPVCGCIHDKNDICCPNTECRFSKDTLNSPKDIKREKAIYALKKELPEKYQSYQDELKELYDKYPITIRFTNKDKKQEFESLLSALETRFLNIKNTA